jgi:hypothetical protein
MSEVSPELACVLAFRGFRCVEFLAGEGLRRCCKACRPEAKEGGVIHNMASRETNLDDESSYLLGAFASLEGRAA